MTRLTKTITYEGIEFTNTAENKLEIEKMLGFEVDIDEHENSLSGKLYKIKPKDGMQFFGSLIIGDYLVKNTSQGANYYFVLNKDEIKYYQVQTVVELKETVTAKDYEGGGMPSVDKDLYNTFCLIYKAMHRLSPIDVSEITPKAFVAITKLKEILKLYDS